MKDERRRMEDGGMSKKIKAAVPAGADVQAKKILVELSVLKLNDLTIQFRGGAWTTAASYTLSDEAQTTRRSGFLEYPTSGRAPLEDVRAAVIAAIEEREGMG
jgi:hypothetical protein